MTSFARGAAAGALAFSMAAMGGCWGVHTAGDYGPSTAESRIEFEWVTNAALARQDTTPEYQNGRFVFVPGTDSLLVISRVTSMMDRPRTKDAPPSPRTDRILERVWLTVPLDVQVGDEIKIEELDERFLAGYDEGYFESGVFVKPARLRGFMTVEEIRPTEAVVRLDLSVEPSQQTGWKVNRVIVAPITSEGIRAAKPTSERVLRTARGGGVPLVRPSQPVYRAESPDEGEAEAAAPVDPAEPAAQNGDADPQPAAADRNIVGKWEGQTPNFNLRYQFFDDGKFISTTVRRLGDNAEPIYQSGVYDFRGDAMQLRIQRYEAGGRSLMSLLKVHTMMLRTAWNGDDLVLTGELEGLRGNVTVRFTPGLFEDLRMGAVAP